MAGRPTNIKSPIGQRLRELRGGLSRDKFASLIGCNLSTYGNYERGDRSPELEFLNKLAEATGVSLNWVGSGQEPKFVRKPSSPGESTTTIDMELLEACIQGTEEHLAEAGQVIDSQNKALIVANLYSLRVKERKAATEKSDVVEADGGNQSRVG